MQAITTKYLGPTNSRGSRVVARCEARRMIVTWDHALSAEENHTRAAKALAADLGWGGRWFGGGVPDRSGYAFVSEGSDPSFLGGVQ